MENAEISRAWERRLGINLRGHDNVRAARTHVAKQAFARCTGTPFWVMRSGQLMHFAKR